MEIHLDKRAVRQIRLSAQEAIEEDDTESLREDILEAFTEDQVEEIERRLDNGDFFEFLTDVIDEWSGDDVDELLAFALGLPIARLGLSLWPLLLESGSLPLIEVLLFASVIG